MTAAPLLKASPTAPAATRPAPANGPASSPGRLRFTRPHPMILFVLAPTLLVAGFEYLIAADQYQSEAHFTVRNAQSRSAPSTGGALGQMLGMGGPTSTDAHTVGDYLESHDAVAAAGKRLPLPAIFRRPEADPVTRLWSTAPSPETLLKYYRRQVDVKFDSETGITKLSVRAYRPEDAQQLADELLRLGEARVNTFNERALENSLMVARQQLREAEQAVLESQTALTGFRQDSRDIDPERTGAAQITLTTSLQQQLAQARAQLSSLGRSVETSSPQYVALAHQVRALEVQTSAAESRLAGQSGAKASGLGVYESLRLRQEFAAKRYQAAAGALEGAREEAARQQLFVIRVVEPNLPVKSLYPKRLKIVATVFFALLLTYGVGWLILAGVREHAS